MKIRQEVFDTYWKFAAERQNIFFKRQKGNLQSYTQDSILNTYKFCNVYRASDRVSQFLIRDVIYEGERSGEDTLFRIFLFRLLNKTETWIKLEKALGGISLKNFNLNKYSNVLSELKKEGPIYGNAFILCANKIFGFEEKHNNHLALLEKVFINDGLIKNIIGVNSLKELFYALKKLPLIGDFMAYQIAIDFNYSEVFNFDEDDFVVAGPGAVRGINKCFYDISPKEYSDIIMWMVSNQEKEFKRLGLKFKSLWGRKMHAVDCQGLFCEVDKYSRIKFPELKSNRKRIKAKFEPTNKRIKYFYP